MLYNIYSVRDQGWERALVVARQAHKGSPAGDFVKWLGTSEVPAYKHGGAYWESMPCGFDKLDLVQRELKKIYPDMHPLGKDTIARKVHEKIHPPDLTRPQSWKYWAQRTADEVLKEMKRRGFNIKHPLNRKHFEKAMLELWRI